MGTEHPPYAFSLTVEDLAAIRKAITAWGKSADIVAGFGNSHLHKLFKTWQQLVTQDWSESGWDYSEYHHDIGSRYWIQLAIEHATPITRVQLEAAVAPLDALFKKRMKPSPMKRHAAEGPFRETTYFWDMHTIYDTAAQSDL